MDMKEIVQLAKDWANEGGHTVAEFIDEVNRRHKHASESISEVHSAEVRR